MRASAEHVLINLRRIVVACHLLRVWLPREQLRNVLYSTVGQVFDLQDFKSECALSLPSVEQIFMRLGYVPANYISTVRLK